MYERDERKRIKRERERESERNYDEETEILCVTRWSEKC